MDLLYTVSSPHTFPPKISPPSLSHIHTHICAHTHTHTHAPTIPTCAHTRRCARAANGISPSVRMTFPPVPSPRPPLRLSLADNLPRAKRVCSKVTQARHKDGNQSSNTYSVEYDSPPPPPIYPISSLCSPTTTSPFFQSEEFSFREASLREKKRGERNDMANARYAK